jgi:hypothetical protein
MSIDIYAPSTWLYGDAWNRFVDRKGPVLSAWWKSKKADVFLIIYLPFLIISITYMPFFVPLLTPDMLVFFQ